MLYDANRNNLKYPKSLRRLGGTVLQCCEEMRSHSKSQMPGMQKCWVTLKFSPFPMLFTASILRPCQGWGKGIGILLKSLMRSLCCLWCQGSWETFSLNSFFFFLNLWENRDKIIHNMSKLLKFLSSSEPKPQSISVKLPLESQGPWRSWFIEHSQWGRELFPKRKCGSQDWESWDSTLCLFLLTLLRLKKKKRQLRY